MKRNLPTIRALATLWIGVVLGAGAVTGCRSSSPSRYISPRVEGKVLDAVTRQPLDGVRVRRQVPGVDPARGEVPKGATALERAPDVRTRSDGSFALASERDLELFGRSHWYSITVNFQHAGYLSLTTNFTRAQAAATARGEPLVQSGDILLTPLSR